MEFNYIYKSDYSGDVPIALQYDEYTNGGTAIQMICNLEGYPEPWSVLTVWLPGLSKEEVAIDVNNVKNGLAWAIENNLVNTPIRWVQSGYVSYPVCKLIKK